MKHLRITTAIALAIALTSTGAWAQEAGTEGTGDTSVGTSAQTEGTLVTEFSGFLGGDEQATTVVDGLRQGSAFTLGGEAGEGGTAGAEGTTVEPPTGTMGYGNVRLSLKMAESQLAGMGITEPTNEELAAALVGGEINGQAVDGVLTMRADGMGWGQIAQEYDTTVGQLMGKGHAGTVTTTTGDGGTQVTTASGNGYIPSHPKGGAPGQVKAAGNGYIPSGKGHGTGAGIVSGAGGAASTGAGNGNAYGHGKGGVSATHAANKNGYVPGSVSGGGAGVTHAAAAAGGAQGLAKGHVNKK